MKRNGKRNKMEKKNERKSKEGKETEKEENGKGEKMIRKWKSMGLRQEGKRQTQLGKDSGKEKGKVKEKGK